MFFRKKRVGNHLLSDYFHPLDFNITVQNVDSPSAAKAN